MVLGPSQGRGPGNVDESIIRNHGQDRETRERSEDGLNQFRVVLTPVRVLHIEGKSAVKIKKKTGKGRRARSGGKRNGAKRRRRKKRYAHPVGLLDGF